MMTRVRFLHLNHLVAADNIYVVTDDRVLLLILKVLFGIYTSFHSVAVLQPHSKPRCLLVPSSTLGSI